MIFASGMSTSEQVSTISGRGVGMDAVKRFLQRQNGDIQIHFRDQTSVNSDYRPIEFRVVLPERIGILLT
ncbi:hypothetical protein WDW89_23070 [Deltaproteobacteria bacterium TL4]